MGDSLPKLGIRAVHPAAHQVGTKIGLGKEALDRAPGDRLDNASHESVPAHLLDRAPDLAVWAADRLAGQGEDLESRHMAELGFGSGARFVPQAR